MSKRSGAAANQEGKRLRKAVERFDTAAFEASQAKKRTAKLSSEIVVFKDRQPVPQRDSNGTLLFKDHPTFRPNLTPKEVLQAGSFGGTYFRPIHSGVTGEDYEGQWKEFPSDWFEGLDVDRQVASPQYREAVNTYRVSCGGDLDMWESSGWITAVDPYGWFQWYCRFYLGRRCSDDERQISRGNGVIGAKGRWRNNLVNKCLATGKTSEEVVDDAKVAPKVRQLLQHWGYRLTLVDLEQARKKSGVH